MAIRICDHCGLRVFFGTDERCPNCRHSAQADGADAADHQSDPDPSEAEGSRTPQQLPSLGMREAIENHIRGKVVWFFTWCLLLIVPLSILTALQDWFSIRALKTSCWILMVVCMFAVAPFLATRTVHHYEWEGWKYFKAIHLAWLDLRMLIGLIPIIGAVIGLRPPEPDTIDREERP